MEIKYKQHYDEGYFTGKKTYENNGRIENYHGPSLTWHGFEVVSNALSKLLPKGTLLDIGCSGGDLAKYLMQKGFDCYGIEISEYAIQNCVKEMKERIALADITECPDILYNYINADIGQSGVPSPKKFPDKFDMLIATDLLEHIYEEDLDKTFNWMLSKCNKEMFFCVATAQNPAPGVNPNKYEFIAKKGEPIPKEFEATAVSGHVNVRTFKWWAKYFLKRGLKISWDKMYMFQAIREKNKGWKDTEGWNMQTTFFLEK